MAAAAEIVAALRVPLCNPMRDAQTIDGPRQYDPAPTACTIRDVKENANVATLRDLLKSFDPQHSRDGAGDRQSTAIIAAR